jgi:hypothetical protein
MAKSKYLQFIQELPLASFYEWNAEWVFNKNEPNLIDQMLQPRGLTYTQWSNFKRKPRKIITEQMICVLKGSEHFKLVSPIYRQNIYVGRFENMRQDTSPIDFFQPNFKKFPFAEQARFLDVVVSAGDCLYVPAYFYVQSETVSGEGQESILVTKQYSPHSQFVDMIFDALEENVLTPEEQHSWDEQVMGYLNNLF